MLDPFQSAHGSYISNYLKTGRSKILGTLREMIGLRSDGIHFPIEVTVTQLLQDGWCRSFTSIIRDITFRKRHEERIKYIARHGLIAALPNRHLFEDQLERALVWVKRENAFLLCCISIWTNSYPSTTPWVMRRETLY
jgi:hypothetical protein